MEKYTKLSEPDERGYAMFKRNRDSKICYVLARWFKNDPEGSTFLVPSSKTKDLRIANCDWK